MEECKSFNASDFMVKAASLMAGNTTEISISSPPPPVPLFKDFTGNRRRKSTWILYVRHMLFCSDLGRGCDPLSPVLRNAVEKRSAPHEGVLKRHVSGRKVSQTLICPWQIICNLNYIYWEKADEKNGGQHPVILHSDNTFISFKIKRLSCQGYAGTWSVRDSYLQHLSWYFKWIRVHRDQPK